MFRRLLESRLEDLAGAVVLLMASVLAQMSVSRARESMPGGRGAHSGWCSSSVSSASRVFAAFRTSTAGLLPSPTRVTIVLPPSAAQVMSRKPPHFSLP